MQEILEFQSSTSRHGGTDAVAASHRGLDDFGFNPLHRGMGVLTQRLASWAVTSSFGFNPLHRGMGVLTFLAWVTQDQLSGVSILYIEAWGY